MALYLHNTTTIGFEVEMHEGGGWTDEPLLVALCVRKLISF